MRVAYNDILMNRNNYSPSFKWEGYESHKPGGSLIVNNNSQSPSPFNHSPKHKIQDLYAQKQAQINRYSSEQEIKKYHQRPYNMVSSDIHSKMDQDRNSGPYHQKNVNWETIKKGMNREAFYRGRDFTRRNNNLPTNTGEPQLIIGNRSEKTLPSFLRNQTKSPDKLKNVQKSAISKQNFKILKRLGQGKFGSVFLAREIYTGMIVALKALNKKKIIQDNLLVQFIRQMKIQTFLDHPNIIRNFGFFSDQQNIYTIMQLGCDGQLYDLIANGVTLSQESTSYIISNLLQAVNVMHKNKILHRDIKPENIVLVLGNVKLCDFGWAVNKKQELRSTFCGTPLYLSPELLQGSRYDEKVDLWAVGILAYELFLGTSPFNINEQQDLVKIITDQVQFPSNKTISKQFKEFIRQILKKNPKQRMACHQLLALPFIKKYQDIQTCEQLCQ